MESAPRKIRGRNISITDKQMAAWIRALRVFLQWPHQKMAARCGLLNQSYTNLEQTGRPGGAVLRLLDVLAIENGFYTHDELKSEMEIEFIKKEERNKKSFNLDIEDRDEFLG